MRIFVCEYVTGGGLSGGSLPPGLAVEGDVMLRALVKDLAALPDIDVVTTRDTRLPAGDLPCTVETLGPTDDVWSSWRRLTEACDALWPIAPESAGLLERLSRTAPESGRLLLGSRPEAVALTTSKRATAAHLALHGIAAAPCGTAEAPPASNRGWVVKPDDGAGCEETRLFETREALRRCRERSTDAARITVQPFVPGPALSLSLLCRDGRAVLLSCNRQLVDCVAGRFRFHGVEVGGHDAKRAGYEAIVARIAAAIPGLWGYVGVDLIEAEEGPLVLEVNPRLTTSYAGLALHLSCNPAALVLDLLQDTMPSIPAATGRRPVAILPAAAYA
ncbi:MAG: ATP-grasp domain-containing protein [Kiloniellales bacterium]